MGVSKMLPHLGFTQSLVSMFLIVVCIIVLMMWSVHEKKCMGKELMEDQKLFTDEMQST